jgi:uncharacterized membrane protein
VDLFSILLFLHVLGAIIAFGPGFVTPIAGSRAAREPQHANFLARVNVATTRGVVIPVSLTVGITGVAMILVRGWSNLVGDRHWLEAAMGLYVVAFLFAVLVQARNGRKLADLTATPPEPAAGPNPAIPATAKQLRYGGYFLAAMVVVITYLMVTKPF